METAKKKMSCCMLVEKFWNDVCRVKRMDRYDWCMKCGLNTGCLCILQDWCETCGLDRSLCVCDIENFSLNGCLQYIDGAYKVPELPRMLRRLCDDFGRRDSVSFNEHDWECFYVTEEPRGTVTSAIWVSDSEEEESEE
jgi:hypothetical protein